VERRPPRLQRPIPTQAPDLGANRPLGVHGGTFELTDEDKDEFLTLAIGETQRIPTRR
jgi:hypothetical protein